MGLAGSMEDSKPGGAGTPGPSDPWASNNADVPDADTPSKLKKPIKSQYQQVAVSGPNMSGNNIQAMQKVSTGGGHHVLTTVNPRQGSEELPKYVEKKGEIDLNADTKEKDEEEKLKEKRQRDKERIESSQEPP